MSTLNFDASPSILGTEILDAERAAANVAPTNIAQPAVAADPRTHAASFVIPETLARPALVLLLAALAIAVYGYHPYSEDAGIYVAGIKQAANPGLYGSSAVFITASSHMSWFSYFNVLLARLGLPLDDQLLGLHILSTWLLLYGCWTIAKHCFREMEARWAAVSLVAVCLSVPVAGSSLFLMDPYVTGRSFSTPLSLFAIAACLGGRALRSALLLVLVGLFHPLMAIYAAGFLLLLWAARQRPRIRTIGTAALIGSALVAGAVVQFSQRTVNESPAYRAAVATRPYFFLTYWHWYELLGLAAPLMLLAVYALWRQRTSGLEPSFGELPGGVVLARTCVATGVTAIAVSLLFARTQSHSHLVAALQPMRAFVLIYLCMFLLLGGVLGQFWLKRIPWRWLLLFGGVAAGIALAQNRTYLYSAHLELPGSVHKDAWRQAFLWARSNTPLDAIFALDADYIHAPGENTQGFRAIAERASLADFSKDGGAAAVFPQLAERWMTEHLAQTGLNRIDDTERRRRLLPLHVTWMVLDRRAETAMPCPFQNDLVKVCRLR